MRREERGVGAEVADSSRRQPGEREGEQECSEAGGQENASVIRSGEDPS
jgi:hypothetical protein